MKLVFFPPASPDDSTWAQAPAWRDHPLTYTAGDELKSSGWHLDNWERELAVPGVEATRIFEQARARLINFDILPVNLVQFTATWNVAGRLPQTGDVVFQRTRFLRIGGLRLLDVLSATRIGEVIDTPDRFLLQYITTSGHPEIGTARYQIEKTPADRVFFKINAISKPGLWITWLVEPVITRRLQLRITHGILETMSKGVLLDLTGQV